MADLSDLRVCVGGHVIAPMNSAGDELEVGMRSRLAVLDTLVGTATLFGWWEITATLR